MKSRHNFDVPSSVQIRHTHVHLRCGSLMFERGFHSNFFRVSTPFAVIKQNKIQITLEMVAWPCKKLNIYRRNTYERFRLLLQNRTLRELKHSFQQYGMVICVSQPCAT